MLQSFKNTLESIKKFIFSLRRNSPEDWVIFILSKWTKTLYQNNLNHITFFFTLFKGYTVNSLYSGHGRDLKLVSSVARVRNSGSLFQSNFCNSFLLGIYLLSVLSGCPQGKSWLYISFSVIRHSHISHNAPCLPIFCITFVFHFSWLLQPSTEKLRTMLMQNFGGKIRCIMGNVESANNTKDNFLWVPEKVNFKFDRNCENADKILFCEI